MGEKMRIKKNTLFQLTETINFADISRVGVGSGIRFKNVNKKKHTQTQRLIEKPHNAREMTKKREDIIQVVYL